MSHLSEYAPPSARANRGPGDKLIASLLFTAAVLAAPLAGAQTVIPVTEDVMTSSFFIGTNRVRGYPGDNRDVLRTSTPGAGGLANAETIYLTFDYDFTSFTGPVNATLTMQTIAGGQNADGTAENPFLASAHAVSADPLTSIIDDTNPGGTITWSNFYNNNILPSDPAASTSISSFGEVEFDISGIVNGWRTGDNTIYALAITGLNDTSGSTFMQGFRDNNYSGTDLGYTYLTVSAVPEPATLALALSGLVTIGGVARRRRQRPV